MQWITVIKQLNPIFIKPTLRMKLT